MSKRVSKNNKSNEESVPYGRTKEYRQQYYQKNREKILSGWKEKVECPVCHKMVTKNNTPRHNNSSFHQLKVLQQEKESNEQEMMKAIKKVLKKTK